MLHSHHCLAVKATAHKEELHKQLASTLHEHGIATAVAAIYANQFVTRDDGLACIRAVNNLSVPSLHGTTCQHARHKQRPIFAAPQHVHAEADAIGSPKCEAIADVTTVKEHEG